jgi:4-diphosphocytidyl-2-C-methyl-D-erythritol kinase
MLCFPNAKINLGLNIISKRPDGYHNIETVFCPVGLSDILEFVEEPDMSNGNVVFTATGIPVDGPEEKNLCVMAYRMLQKDFGLPALHIHLHKIIPPGAGLGGGSSDAAFMLKSLNTWFQLHIDEDTLCNYASMLGSDCAFFILNRPLFGYERGNIFRELTSFPSSCEVVVINPGIHIGTAEAYGSVIPGTPGHSLLELITLPVAQWRNHLVNDFESGMVRKYPVIGEIIEKLYAAGAAYAAMSGSGSSVFGLFNQKAPDVKTKFPGFFYWSGPLNPAF